MAIQPNKEPRWLEQLRARHLPNMRPEVKRTLLALAEGCSRKEIARREGVEPATIKRWIETATAEIAAGLDDEHVSGGELRGSFVVLHLLCCLEKEAGEAA